VNKVAVTRSSKAKAKSKKNGVSKVNDVAAL
jgi:hypothetical protein